MKKRITYNGYKHALGVTSLTELAMHEFPKPSPSLQPKKCNLPNLVVYPEPLEYDFTPLAEALGNEPGVKKDFARHALIHKSRQPHLQHVAQLLGSIISDMKKLEVLGWPDSKLRVVGHNTYDDGTYKFHTDTLHSRIMRNYTPHAKTWGLAHEHAVEIEKRYYKPTTDAGPFSINASDFTLHAGKHCADVLAFIHCAENTKPEDPHRLILVSTQFFPRTAQPAP